MKCYLVTFSLPHIEDSPTVTVTVEASGRQSAIDAGFDQAFAEYPQYGGFQLEDIEEERE